MVDGWINETTKKTVQLWKCPSCGHKHESKIITYHCAVCGKQLCYDCNRSIMLDYRNYTKEEFFCDGHYRRMLRGFRLLEKFMKKRQLNQTNILMVAEELLREHK